MDDNNNLSASEMSSIYIKLSVTDEYDIDENEELKNIQSMIEELFDEKFRQISSSDLLNNSLLVNNKLVELIKYSTEKYKYKNIAYLFLGFCDYFDIDCPLVFKCLHKKIQFLIEEYTKRILGKKYFSEVKRKNSEHPNLNIPTLFDIIKK